MPFSCSNCNSLLREDAKFCSACGQAINVYDVKKDEKSVKLIIAFYASFLLFTIISFFIYANTETSFWTDLSLEIVFVLLTVGFFLFDAKKILALYNFKKVDWKALVLSVFTPIITALLVYFGMNELNLILFDENYNLYLEFADYENSFFWAFLFVAILPPIFEELAFRGFLFNQMLNVSTPQVTILATAFIFALVHFSFISIVWIFPFGILLGFLRYKYNTLWLGMIIHFIHNFLVLLFEYIFYLEQAPAII